MLLNCYGNNPAARQLTVRFTSAMGVYTVLVIAAALCFVRLHPHGAFAYVLSIVPAVPIVAGISAAGMYLREEKDEFQRMVFVQCLLWALGGVLVVTSTWGLLQVFTHVHHFQPMWVFPLFCGFVGISVPLVLRSYR